MSMPARAGVGRTRAAAGHAVPPACTAAVITLFALAAADVTAARAQSVDNVLVLVNGTSDASRQIGDYYARRRGIPGERVLELNVPTSESISRENYVERIERPLARWLTSHSLQDRILYIVLTKGIPLRVTGTEGRGGSTASVDSELTLLYRRLVGGSVSTAGPIVNPYFLGDRPIRDAHRFSRLDQDIYLVTRLDGYTMDDVIGLIDRAQSAVREGNIALDLRGTLLDRGGDRWLRQAAEVLVQAGFSNRIVLEKTTSPLRDVTGLLGYYSWGSNDPAVTFRDPGVRFVPGALVGMFVSTDGRTFAEPPADWQIGTWSDRRTWFGGSPQSLAGDMVRVGATGVAAHVSEPFLDGTIRPQILFPAYLLGMNLAEAFYLAMPNLSWQTVILGDPLCGPFRTQPLPPAEIDNGLDGITGLPATFAERRAALLALPGIDLAAVRLFLKGETRLASGDRAGAREALEQATALASRLTAAQLVLASIYEAEHEYAKAAARYKQIIDIEPNHVFALNNLAYTLAERQGSPAEGLTFAERAYRLSPEEPRILDTLGWTHHLLGTHDKALPLLVEAARLAPKNADILLHAAIASAVAKRFDDARRYLAGALAIAPALVSTEKVVSLRRQLP
jgi:uncharacterized protein (TIGR03790 family)